MARRCALCVRCSSDRQRAASIEARFRVCREREGWKIVGASRGAAVSGDSVILRPGVQALPEDARRGAFEILVAEALDRDEAADAIRGSIEPIVLTPRRNARPDGRRAPRRPRRHPRTGRQRQGKGSDRHSQIGKVGLGGSAGGGSPGAGSLGPRQSERSRTGVPGGVRRRRRTAFPTGCGGTISESAGTGRSTGLQIRRNSPGALGTLLEFHSLKNDGARGRRVRNRAPGFVPR